MLEVIEALNDLSVSQAAEAGFGTDLLTEVLRKGACELLAQAIEQEVQEWLAAQADLTHDRIQAGNRRRALGFCRFDLAPLWLRPMAA